MKKKETYGSCLRSEREKANITMGQLARHLEFTTAYISDIEHDKRGPLSPSLTDKAALFIGTDPEPLHKLSARQRGGFVLSTGGRSQKAIEAGTALARSWEDFDDDVFDELIELLTKWRESAPSPAHRGRQR
jgi:transcriptional regulator with XRE-family HTH domain